MGFGIWELLCTQERVTEPLDHTKQMWKKWKQERKNGNWKERVRYLLTIISGWWIFENFEEEEIQAWKVLLLTWQFQSQRLSLESVRTLLGKIQKYGLQVRGTCHLVDNCCLTFQATFVVFTAFLCRQEKCNHDSWEVPPSRGEILMISDYNFRDNFFNK